MSFFSHFFSPTIHMTDTKVYNGENQRRDVETELTENNFHDILTNWTFSETKVPLCDTRSSRMPTGQHVWVANYTIKYSNYLCIQRTSTLILSKSEAARFQQREKQEVETSGLGPSRTPRTDISIYSPRHFNSSSQTTPFPAPKPALTTALVAFPMFNILHTTFASTMSHESSQTVPYLPLWRTWHRKRCHLTRVQLIKTRWSAWNNPKRAIRLGV